MKRSRSFDVLATASILLLAACEREPEIDWSAPENIFAVEKTEKNEDGSTRLEFHSLIDAPADAIYKALAEPENYAMFVEGVSESGILSTAGETKTTYITQKVIGRQNRAKVKWTLHPAERKIEFETLESDLSYNDGWYSLTPSPDGKRVYVVSVYNLRQKGSTQIPPGVAASGAREAFKAAANSVKKRALGQDTKASS
ncbi:MAG: SRPBCC family protein [Candidatus Binatia bacterium]